MGTGTVKSKGKLRSKFGITQDNHSLESKESSEGKWKSSLYENQMDQ
ncbi:hypothetical protein [Leptospira levettii]|nr:hypothetical protein [Leptospira levettii]